MSRSGKIEWRSGLHSLQYVSDEVRSTRTTQPCRLCLCLVYPFSSSSTSSNDHAWGGHVCMSFELPSVSSLLMSYMICDLSLSLQVSLGSGRGQVDARMMRPLVRFGNEHCATVSATAIGRLRIRNAWMQQGYKGDGGMDG